jgi:hypothetical protein
MVERKTVSVDEMYSRGRSFPHGQTREVGHRRSLPHEPSMAARDEHRNQAPEDRHSSNYDQDVADDWRNGGGARGATGKPSFDKSGAWRAGRGGIAHGQGDPAVIRRPEPNKP